MKAKGFTLIELVVVIVILGILAAIAIPKYIDITGKAEESADKGQASGLRGATHMIYASNVIHDVKPDNTNHWPEETTVWSHMTETSAWHGFGYTYSQTEGSWTANTN